MTTPLVLHGTRADPGPAESGVGGSGLAGSGLAGSAGSGLAGSAGSGAHSDFQQLYGDGMGYRVVERVVVSGARNAASRVELQPTDDDILEIEDVDRVVTFHRASAIGAAAGAAAGGAPADLLQDVARGHNQGRVSEVRQTRLTLPPEIKADLGVLEQSLPDQVVTAAGGMIFEPAARAAMRRIAEWIDTPVPDDAPSAVRRKRAKLPGLYAVDADLRLDPGDRLTAPAEPGGPQAPYLLLVHGTFSHTEGAFGALRGTDEWLDLVRFYEGRVLALEHPTLSRTPAENALEVAALLPEKTPLHVLSHSRGGLVGDVLSLCCAAPEPDLGAYGARGTDPEHPDLKALPALHDLLRGRGVSVRRYARVAAPARGTTLASRRLDRFGTYLYNLLRLVPGWTAPGMVELVQKFVLTLLDQRSDPRLVPGLEAQMPESALVRMLNTAGPVDDGLGNITGDIEGSGVARRLVVFGADLFYRADNDLVVNTGSMSGGVPRKRVCTRFFQGCDVSHNSYFSNEPSRRAVHDWLTARDDAVEGFVPGGTAESTSRAIRGRALSRGAALGEEWPADKAPNGFVVVVPDLFGSRFLCDDLPAWPDGVRNIAANGIEWLLTPPEPDAHQAPDLLPVYGPLVQALKGEFAVKPFPYDPRLPLDRVVDELQAQLPTLLNKGRQRVHVVAHGYGCLVALALRERGGVQWQTLQRGGGRTILLSPPLFGTWTAPRRVSGQDELTGALTLLRPELSAQRIGQLFGKLPAFADLAPLPADALEERTRRLQREDWTGTVAVFGRSESTPGDSVTGPGTASSIGTGPDAGSGDQEAGDGYVSYRAAAVPGLTAWYAAVPFADLPSDPNTVTDVVRLLANRKPQRLIGAPPPLRIPASRPRGGGMFGPPLGPPLALFPDPAELARLALGAGMPVEVPPYDELHVSVVHGDIARMDGCVMVGTYDGTPIGGAEAALDRRLNGALTRHRVLGQYPGPSGTRQLFSHEGNDGLTAAVIGLGDPGELTAGRLTTGVFEAALRLAARQLDIATAQVAGGAAAERIRMILTTVLIGTTGAVALPIGVAVPAIVAGVRRANRRLTDQRHLVEQLDVVIDGLCFAELYEDRAADAVRSVLELAGSSSEADGRLVVDSTVRDGRGGLPGSLQVTDRRTMWQTIRVGAAPGARRRRAGTDEADDGLVELSFTSVGRSARAEQRVSSGQREIIESLVARCIDDPTVDRQLYNTLYELIVPNSLKSQGRERENIMLVLDDAAARLPFEMLATRSHEEDDEPLAVSVGMVRRLESSRFREGTRLATGARALVIADPPTTRFQRLPGAIREASEVADVLAGAGYEVTRLIPRDVHDDTSVDPVKVMNALFAHDYRIVHIAAHGDFNPDDPARSGVVIGDRAFLTALEIQQMQTAPDLFFLNCCHLGSMTPVGGGERRQDWRPDRLAASISRELIDIGTRAVVAAGWAVDDEKARQFARVFYQQLLLDGADLGTASRLARASIYPRPDERQVNTWGAYQVYGAPALLLTTGKPGADRPREPRSRGEFLRLLNGLADQADRAEGQRLNELRRTLLDLEATAPPAWLDGEAFQAFGNAYRNLGDAENSATAFEKALDSWGSAASLRTVDRLITAHTLWGVALSRQPGHDHDAKKHFERAESLLEGLDHLIQERPPERISLRGGYYRRRLLVGGDVDGALRSAHEAYAKAAKLYRDTTGDVDPYATLRAVALGWLRAARQADKPWRGLRSAREQVLQARRQVTSAPYPDEWARLARVDAELMLALLALGRRTTGSKPTSPGPETSADQLAREYVAQFEAGASMRIRRSVVENLEILWRCLPVDADGRPLERVAKAAVLIRSLKAALERWQPVAGGDYSTGGTFLDS